MNIRSCKFVIGNYSDYFKIISKLVLHFAMFNNSPKSPVQPIYCIKV